MVQNFSIITAEKGNQQSSVESMGGMSTCKMLPNVKTVIIAEEGHSDLTNIQLTQSVQGM